MQSLLGQFYNRIRGSQEDIASEGLTYILKHSLESRQIINQIVKINSGLVFSDLSYHTQNTGKDNERPDISGIDQNGREVLLIEAKFWASLTRNQPNGYLNRLHNDSALIFLVPTLRIRPVFEEVKARILEDYQEVNINFENHSIFIKTSNKFVLIKSWNEILNAIKSKLEQTNNQILISDLNQIIGLCETIDKNAFLPISDEDLSPKIPKSINSYYEIVDKVVDELRKRHKDISIKGLNKTTQRYGYHRYFKNLDLGFNFALKLDLWEKHADTPFWLSVSQIIDNRWTTTENLKQSVEILCSKSNHLYLTNSFGSGYFLNIKPLLYKTEDIVVNDLATQIEVIISEITNANNGYNS